MIGTVSYAALIDGRWLFSDAPFAGVENTVFQIENGRMYAFRQNTVEEVHFEEGD